MAVRSCVKPSTKIESLIDIAKQAHINMVIIITLWASSGRSRSSHSSAPQDSESVFIALAVRLEAATGGNVKRDGGVEWLTTSKREGRMLPFTVAIVGTDVALSARRSAAARYEDPLLLRRIPSAHGGTTGLVEDCGCGYSSMASTKLQRAPRRW